MKDTDIHDILLWMHEVRTKHCQDPDPMERLVAFGEGVIDMLISALDSRETAIRSEAAFALGDIHFF